VSTTTRADRFRARVSEVYDLDALGPADEEALDEIAVAMTMLDTIRAALADSPLVEVRQGGARVSPLVVEERLRASALSAALARFPALADED
jgi:hypothetical protein